MARKEPSQNVVPMVESHQLSLQQDDAYPEQSLLRDPSPSLTERIQDPKNPGESKIGLFSTLSGEDGGRSPQEHPSKDNPLEEINILDVEMDQAEPYNDNLHEWQREPEIFDDFADDDEGGQDIAVNPQRAVKSVHEDVQGTPAVNPGGIARVIYAENKRKACLAHAVLDSLGPKVIEPLYYEPSDTDIYHENRKKFQVFKQALMLYFKRKAQEREGGAENLSGTCNQMMEPSQNEMGQKGSNGELEASEQQQQQRHHPHHNQPPQQQPPQQQPPQLQFFEKQSPDLKKQRQEQPRIAKPRKRERVSADMQVIKGFYEQLKAEHRERSRAIIPPLRTGREHSPCHETFQTLVEDPLAELKERQSTNAWDDQEKNIFREKFIEHPKKFHIIASYLDKKSAADCVEYYYLSKKRENYKQFTRKRGTRKGSRAVGTGSLRSSERQPVASSAPSSVSSSRGPSRATSSTFAAASGFATSGMDMTETIMAPAVTDTTPDVTATHSSGLTQEEVAPAPPPAIESPGHGWQAATPSLPQHKAHHLHWRGQADQH
ncbi:hypothetical protein HPB48_015482 [Haemaphysalis longicornis]|uniref:SANT domain-containing protein n=1 Tax=Haemaphysalis longicornis TaxID=44386 RepID=A0A9J6FKT9_HAELO|nr:hypothetical protein HPB48_015482 [Haemaphysalis longicornis]